jgi:hypothetical protein
MTRSLDNPVLLVAIVETPRERLLLVEKARSNRLLLSIGKYYTNVGKSPFVSLAAKLMGLGFIS